MNTNSPLTRQRFFILIVMVAAVFLPSLVEWSFSPTGAWYRPYVVWMLAIILTIAIQYLPRGK